jgi:serine protease Do
MGMMFLAAMLWIIVSVCPAVTWGQAAALSPDAMAAVKQAEAARIAIIEQLTPTVVAVYGPDRKGAGSAVLISDDGLALTNFHVVQPTGGSGHAGLSDGKLYPWKVVGQDPGGDVALIQLTGKDKFDYALLGDSNATVVGEWVMAMGNPFMLADDNTPTVTLGIVSGTGRYQPGSGGNMLVYGDCIQIDSSINPGNSGGPLFDMTGRLIGINGRGSFEERGRVNVGVGYAISIEQIRNFMADLMATKICQHATLDMTFAMRDGQVVCDAIDIGRRPPLVEAGMQLGDRLLRFDGRPVRHANDLTNWLSTLPAGWPVEITFQRGDQEQTVRITPAALPYAQPRRRPQPRTPKPEPDQPEMPRIPWWPAKADKPKKEPGRITDLKLNRQMAERIVKRLGQIDPEGRKPEARAFIAAYDPADLTTFKTLRLEGSERLLGHRAYRVLATTKEGKTYRAYVSVFDQDGMQLEEHLMRVEVVP